MNIKNLRQKKMDKEINVEVNEAQLNLFQNLLDENTEMLNLVQNLRTESAQAVKMLFEARSYMSRDKAEEWQKRINEFLLERV